MVSSTGTHLGEMMAAFTDDQLASLARTCSCVRHPIWVQDLSDRCVYRNAPADPAACPSDDALVFDILDHNGNVVGTLATIVN
jgi:hypothetical protein